SQRSEISGTDDQGGDSWAKLLLDGLSARNLVCDAAYALRRKAAGNGRGFYAGERFQARLELIEKRRLRRGYRAHEQVRSPYTGICRVDFEKAADQDARSGQKHYSERDFSRDENGGEMISA